MYSLAWFPVAIFKFVPCPPTWKTPIVSDSKENSTTSVVHVPFGTLVSVDRNAEPVVGIKPNNDLYGVAVFRFM